MLNKEKTRFLPLFYLMQLSSAIGSPPAFSPGELYLTLKGIETGQKTGEKILFFSILVLDVGRIKSRINSLNGQANDNVAWPLVS